MMKDIEMEIKMETESSETKNSSENFCRLYSSKIEKPLLIFPPYETASYNRQKFPERFSPYNRQKFPERFFAYNQQKFPERFSPHKKGLMLYGPPGSGKSSMIKNIAIRLRDSVKNKDGSAISEDKNVYHVSISIQNMKDCNEIMEKYDQICKQIHKDDLNAITVLLLEDFRRSNDILIIREDGNNHKLRKN